MARLTQIVVDCADAPSLARFWEAALDEFSVRPYDDEEVKRLAEMGLTPETDPTVILDGPHLEICFQRVDDIVPTAKRRLHLDVAAADLSAEVERLSRLGAEVVEVHAGHTWMRDPEGNDFCVVDSRRWPATSEGESEAQCGDLSGTAGRS